MTDDVKAQVKQAMSELDEIEIRVLKEVLRIEHENLHLKKPQLKAEILQNVREIVK